MLKQELIRDRILGGAQARDRIFTLSLQNGFLRRSTACCVVTESVAIPTAHAAQGVWGKICAKLGIYAASRALRHSDIAITSQHYLDKKKPTTIGMGHLLKLPTS